MRFSLLCLYQFILCSLSLVSLHMDGHMGADQAVTGRSAYLIVLGFLLYVITLSSSNEGYFIIRYYVYLLVLAWVC